MLVILVYILIIMKTCVIDLNRVFLTYSTFVSKPTSNSKSSKKVQGFAGFAKQIGSKNIYILVHNS
jgi:hypothetical protein